MRYEDFEVRIRGQHGRGFRSEVLNSLYGPAESPLKLPFTSAQVRKLPEVFEQQVRHDSTCASPRSRASLATREIAAPPEKLGHALFEALFAGNVGKRFRECLAHLDGRHRDEGLRIRLNFDLDNPGVAALAALPWEMLRDPERSEFLSRSRRTPIVRFLSVPRPPLPPLRGPLRILVIQSAPTTSAVLNLAAEWRKMWASLKRQPAIEVLSIEHPTLGALRQLLLEETWHVLHFMGHGGFDRTTGEGSLLFEDATGRSDRVTSTMLGENLKSFPDLRLVFVNACRTGALPRRNGQDPYTGIAPALLRAGIPAVLAMQFPIGDNAAIAFSSSFYARLAAHDPVDAAVVEGRLAVLRLGSLDWATPVLFTRVPDGDILGLDGTPVSLSTRQVVARGARAGLLKLGIRSFLDDGEAQIWTRELQEDCEDVLDLRHYFAGASGRYIRHPSLWQTHVVPELQAFLANAARERRPLHLNIAAHATIAFAAGYFLDANSGLDITIRQRGQVGIIEWRPVAGLPLDGPLLRTEAPLRFTPRGRDVALALAVSRPILEDVKVYLARTQLSIRQILRATLAPAPSISGVRDGLHALKLAQAIARKLRNRSQGGSEERIHLLGSAPNALFFFLGQLGHGLAPIQLYEYDFESKVSGAYSPSIALPPPGGEGGGPE
jgi:CHAT domain/SMODS-associated and fused to various effectors sensor domain